MTLEELETQALIRGVPIMQKEGLRFLVNLIQEHHYQRVLEIGSAIGYSSIMMASHVEDVCIETIEINEASYLEAKAHIQEFGLEDRIYIHHSDALTFDLSLRKMPDYDVLFIDAAKAQYQKFFERYMPLVQEGGVAVVDNLDFHGMVYHIEDIKNRNTRQLVKKIKRFKEWILNHPDYTTVYEAIGDGIVVIKRRTS